MICFEVHIDLIVEEYFRKNLKFLTSFEQINERIKSICGINDFFINQEYADEFFDKIQSRITIVSEPDRREYGDFQTNSILTDSIVDYIKIKRIDFEFVLEPTCGKGNFIISALKKLPNIKKLVGVEIYQPYIWETKFKILSLFLSSKKANIPEIDIIHANAFKFSYENLAKETKDYKTLVIGNPPWVTNSELSSIDSKNLPKKSNFKKHKGLEAITGKGNFDIGENISVNLIQAFQRHVGHFAFLVKNSVIKNVIYDQKENNFLISENEKLNIDAKKEFNVSVNASLFVSKFREKACLNCSEYDFYTKQNITAFGWYLSKFVYSIDAYEKGYKIDGLSNIVWRSGIKHDCSKIMEFEQDNGHFTNGFKIEMQLEDNLVYGLLKSSDLKSKKTNTFRKLTIITQKKIGQDTKYIKEYFINKHIIKKIQNNNLKQKNITISIKSSASSK